MKKYKLIIAEDELYSRKGIEKLLSYDPEVEIIDICSNGNDAFDAITSSNPDIVLLDINMPGIGGIAALSQSKKKYPSLGVIMVTGFPEEEIALRTMKLGAYDFATKPIDINYLDLCVSILAISSDH